MERPYLSAIHVVREAPENVDVFRGFVVSGSALWAGSGQKITRSGRIRPGRSSFICRSQRLLSCSFPPGRPDYLWLVQDGDIWPDRHEVTHRRENNHVKP